MDRNREARRATNMAAPPNGLSSSRRRHRTTRDSPDEDGGGGMEIQERLRDRGGVVKRDRGSIRSKRRRENRLINQNQNQNQNHHSNNNRDRDRDRDRDDADDTSEESVNDEEGEDEDDGGVRMLPPPPSNNHHGHHRKTFPPSANNNKLFRTAPTPPPPPPPAWKPAADEMIGVSVPRKARSASTKRSHEWISGGGGGGGGGHEQINRQLSTSPVNLAASPAPLAAPPSPSSSSISVRKKMKAANGGGGSKPRPPKSSSKSSSSNPEELEIEIAEVLYGLMTQSQAAPSKKENDSNNKSSSDNNKSRVSSPISNSTHPVQNSTSLSTVAPKRKRPRQVSENPFSRSSSVSPSIKNEIDHQHQHHQSPKTDLEENSQISAAATGDNCVPFGFTSLPSDPPMQKAEQDGKCGVDVSLVLTKQEAEKKSLAAGLNDGNKITQTVITTPTSMTMTNIKAANSEATSQKEEKFEIDLMAPPPQQRTSPERDENLVAFSEHKQMATQEANKNKEDEKLRKIGKEETMNLIEEQKKSKIGSVQESGESLSKQQVMKEERIIGLHIDLEKPNKDTANVVSGSSNRSLHQALKHQQLSAKPETHTEKTAQPSSMQMPMPVANWPSMGYVAPLQGVISMDGNTMPSAPVQPIFTHPRPKRCATHCYIARNIHYLQQFMKINPFWPAASGAAPMFGAKPCGLNVTELGHGTIPQSTQDKGHVVNMFPGHPAGKDNKSSQGTTIPDSAQRKQQVLLQQALPPVTPNNILHGPAFIFPFNQQQAVAAASASVRPGSSKVNNNTSTAGAVGLGPGASGSANSTTVGASTTAAAPALSFNYPNMSANETQYLAILQNNPYTFPIPAVGAPPNYRGNPHGQPMPMFNGSFYSSQMIHPSQIPQPPQQQAQPSQSQSHHPSQSQQISQTHQNSSGSTSSSQRQQQQQQQQQQQRQQQQQQQGGGVAVNGGGSMHNSYPVPHKSRSQASQHMNPPPPQARHLENEVTGGEDSPSTADSRVSRAANTMSVYGHNFAMPVQNFAMMNPQAAMSNATASGSSNDKKHQQQSQQQGSKRSGVESSSLPPQTFAMSFAPMNGTTGAMAQNHAIFQSLPESLRQSYHHMIQTAPASAHHSQQKKDFRVSEEASRTINHESSNAEEDRKGSSGMTGKSGQSIAFSRPDLSTDASGSSSPILGTSVIDSSSRNINLGSNNNRSSRSPISTSVAAAQSSHHHLHAQFQQQQQVLQLQKQQQQQQQQQQQNMNARSKNPVSNNGSPYPDHLMTSSSSMAAAKFPNSLSSFPQNLVQTGNTTTSPGQSPQWRNSVRGGPATTQVPSSLSSATTSSLKNLHQSHQAQQQQSSRPHPQSHTQISFGTAGQKLQSTTSLQMQQQQQQQQQNQNLGSNSSNQSPSPPMLVGSPSTSSISKGGGGVASTGGGSPRTNAGSASTSGRAGQASSLSSSQQAKNSPVGTQRSSPSILGNPHNPNSNKSQQQLPKQTLQQQQAHAQAQAAQAHMFFTHPYMQVQQPQAQQHSGGATTTSGYYLPRKQQQLQQSSQPQQSSSSTSSTAMLSLCPPVTLANTSTTTSDPAKAIAAATSNLKGGVGQGILHAAQYGGATQSSMPAGFPQYNAHNNAPASVQVKATEQKQPAGNDTLRTWQPEKK